MKAKYKELAKLSKPTDDQEAIFKKYRRILNGSDPKIMPYTISMYAMSNIKLERTNSGAYGEVFKGVVIGEHLVRLLKKRLRSSNF